MPPKRERVRGETLGALYRALCSEADGAFAVCVVQDQTPASADEANVVGAAKSQAAKAVLRGGSVRRLKNTRTGSFSGK